MKRLVILLGALGCGRICVDAAATDDAAAITACTAAACPPGYLIRDGGCYRLV